MKKFLRLLFMLLLFCAMPTTSAFADDYDNLVSGDGGDHHEDETNAMPSAIDPADDGHTGQEAE